MSGEADQWSKIISRERIPAPDGRRVTYLGESWTLSYMIQWKSRGSVSEKDDMMNNRPPPSEVDDDSGGLHVPVPMEQDTPSPRSAIASSMVRDQLPPDIQLALIEAYFAYNHILYPVVSEDEFRTGFANRTLSPLLLAAVLYAGALHVSDPVIYRAGFDSRQTCLRKLYNRSKKIFFDEEDNGETGDQLSRVQAAFLLHNMWSSPNATMDPWTWLGLATRLAQNMGMHRSTARSSLKESDRRLWKRIWWSLYSRDMQIASALGKPTMINAADCDVQQLDVDDFEPRDSMETRLFVIEQARLSEICGEIISCRFAPGLREDSHEREQKSTIMRSLTAWKDNIPHQLQYPKGCAPERVSFQALLLQVLFNNLLLLLHRPRILPSSSDEGAENNTTSWKIAFTAAGVITQVTETIMNYKSLYHCPLFYTSALFGAMTMHVIRGAAGEHQLSLCMIAMRTLSTMYWAAGWIRNIFQKLGEKKQRSSHAHNTSVPPTRVPSPVPLAGVRAKERQSGATPYPQRLIMDQVPWPTPETTESLLASGPTYLGSPSQGGLDPVHLQSAPEGPDSWNDDPGGAGTGVFGSLGRNAGVFIDYPMIDSSGFGGIIDPDLADCWQDLLAADNPFNNPFILGGMPR
ncbi:hypothetical protein NKR23_g302 [Pleurostoma richardsiae]|uniref:Xylanolytic transcriptional activator regulatory domain-containing protein n=1 Tax=Pleurostoma richardsiae TaxID=41990 RepID=A0AA38S1Z1_9PEZI|nr:hypothetical protein NKR23_g302 [Pleurostoma richardsiae]